MPKTTFSIRVENELKEELAALAKADRRTTAAYIEGVLIDHVAERKARAKTEGGD